MAVELDSTKNLLCQANKRKALLILKFIKHNDVFIIESQSIITNCIVISKPNLLTHKNATSYIISLQSCY